MSTIKITDPLYAKQWHLKALGGDIEKIWADYDGTGVHTGVYDTGIEKNHEDLKGAYDASRELVINGVRADPAGGDGIHGTAVAGLIAGQVNGIGGVGVSYGASLTGVNIFSGVAGNNMIAAIQQMSKFDTVNNSWGWGSTKYVDNTSVSGSFGQQFVQAFASVAETGRNGLGTIIVNSAGNGWASAHQDANTSAFNQSRHTLTVGAIGQDGSAASYSNRGASLLVSAPSSEGKVFLTTTDRTGASGFDASNYSAKFGGTSGAAPIVTGVTNLMLDANDGLGWRDVQNILAITADHTGAASLRGETAGRMGFGWTINAADNVNGGGLHYSNDVGFGRVDAFEAVRYAEVWSQFRSSQTSGNEQHVTTGGNAALKIAGTTQFSFRVDDVVALEHADLTLTLTHPNVADLRIELVSPEGTVTRLQDAGGAAFAANNWTWTFGSEALRGELSKGDWIVRIVDTNGGAAGELKGFSFDGYGSVPTNDDVYHFTSDYAKSLAADTSRGILHDTDGGTDWINAAGLVANVAVDLRSGARSDLGAGATFSVGTSVIENAVTGDGHDTLTGNGLANQLMGMRGNDVLFGLAGNDTLMGGAGADILVGGLGDDLLIGGEGNDLYVFRSAGFGNDTIRDFEIGIDKIDLRGSGLSFSDLTFSWSGTTQVLSIFEQDGTISFANTPIDLAFSDFLWGDALNGTPLDPRDVDGDTGGDAADPGSEDQGDEGAGELPPVLVGGGAGDAPGTGSNPGTPPTGGAGTGSGQDHPPVKHTVSATDFALSAGDLNLTLTGSARAGTGNDLANKIIGNDAANTLVGNAGDDALYGGKGSDILQGGIGNDKLFGQDGNDVLDGGTGADTLDGGFGADLLRGGAGADKYVVDDLGDVVDEAYGQDVDDGAVDSVTASVSFTLGRNLEKLTLIGGARVGIGNELANKIVGNDTDNTLVGNGGDDGLYGGKGADLLQGGTGNDKLYGQDGNDVLEGGADADTLDGGLGADILRGGAGADKYVVDDLGDVVDEVYGQAVDDGAVDSVTASISFTLGRNLENLTLTGGARVGIGNELANKIVGNDTDNTLVGNGGNDALYGGKGADLLQGGTGNDKLYGQDGNDVLEGGADADTLDGGLGADILRGGSGADKYVVDDLGDVVDEVYGQGVDDGAVDSVTASVSFTLGRNVENLTLTGGARAGTGNELGNKITGNDADNRLEGGAGNDTLLGNGGRDVLFGGAGKDILTGGTGADTFLFAEANGTSTDKITDFSSAQGDQIGIEAAGFGLQFGQGIDAGGGLMADWFEIGSVASRGHAEFYLDANSKTLYWDADGRAGNSIALATFSNAVDLSHHNFALV